MIFTLKITCNFINSAFVANVVSFLSKLALFMNPAILDLSTNSYFFMLLATIYLVNLLKLLK